MIEIYTDGGNSAKNKVGGCAAVVCNGKLILAELSKGYDHDVTNNQMELAAVLMGLEYILNHPNLNKDVTIISDSEYVINGASKWLNVWKRKNWKTTTGNVKNRVLWEAIDSLKESLNITWKWVKGHSNIALNNLADELAVKAYTKLIKS
jgi:ribonuclease HI